MIGALGTVDLVCWDFGDTLVDERFMRIAPSRVPEWTTTYDRVLDQRPSWVDEWMCGRASLNDLVEPLVAELAMTPAAVSRHLRGVWSQIEWYPEARAWLERLNGVVPQAIVTVNPWEFEGIAVACDVVPLVDVIVTSAELGTVSKVSMAQRARQLLGMSADLSTTLLIDNKRSNVDEFEHAGGQGLHFTRERFTDEAERLLGPML